MRVGILIAAVGAALTVFASPASAGGYCAGGPFADASGDQVVMKQDCFGPTVLRVEPGATVRFRNLDGHPHTVGGAAGTFGEAHGEISPGQTVAYRFADPGVFPYFCVLHPGMTGAVVVGDGGEASTFTPPVAEEEVVPADEPADAGDAVDETLEPVGEATSVLPAIAGAGVGMVAGGGLVGAAVRRRRRGRP